MAVKSIVSKIYPEVNAGGFSRRSGTVEFYTRINALIRPDMTILDYGAGRGLVADSKVPFVNYLTSFKGRVARVIGADVDEAVFQNPLLDQACLLQDGKLPLPDHSIDLIFSDHVFEHIENPDASAHEMGRVLRPGGWICARTPSSMSLIALAARLVPNSLHAKAIRHIQPDGPREDHDVFPTRYRMNSKSTLKRLFPNNFWNHYSYYWNGDPTYHMGSIYIAKIMQSILAIKPGGEKLMVFIQKAE